MALTSEPASTGQWTLVRNARQLLTLHGPSGSRRGSAMTELNIVPKGALLIRNGIIEDVGPARRVENLAGARNAREIDATGKVVMPAFVDADVALLSPPVPSADDQANPDRGSTPVRLMSRKKVLARAAATAAEFARYGCLSIGAHTRCATDLQNIGKLLRVHQALQSKPMRIRSIFSPRFPNDGAKALPLMSEALISRWLPSVKNKKLASVLELTVGGPEAVLDGQTLEAVAIAAAGLGYAMRLRSALPLDPVHLQLALAAGAIGIIAPLEALRTFDGPLAAVGCIRVIPASEGFDNAEAAAATIRSAINEGSAIALTSSYRALGSSSFNMQYLLHLAVHQLGLTMEEAVTATTWNPACSLRLSHVTASLEPGKSADLLVMDVPDYHDLPRRVGHNDISVVMRAGHVVLRSPSLSVD
ncbi:MAG TPA: amidohydrolase family protein [Bryobacteraceae bacterium]|nr:amidohydrolase family protein [Bryobacteraceae bacterium]